MEKLETVEIGDTRRANHGWRVDEADYVAKYWTQAKVSADSEDGANSRKREEWV